MIKQCFRKIAQGKWVCPLHSGLFTDSGCALVKGSHVESRLASYNDSCTRTYRLGLRAQKAQLWTGKWVDRESTEELNPLILGPTFFMVLWLRRMVIFSPCDMVHPTEIILTENQENCALIIKLQLPYNNPVCTSIISCGLQGYHYECPIACKQELTELLRMHMEAFQKEGT